MKVLVITSCTSRKRDCETPAAEMYTGAQYTLLMEGLEQVWGVYGKRAIDLAIVSAKYGLLSEHDVIVPYNVTFQGLKKKEILARSDRLQLHERTKALIERYDLISSCWVKNTSKRCDSLLKFRIRLPRFFCLAQDIGS